MFLFILIKNSEKNVPTAKREEVKEDNLVKLNFLIYKHV